MKSILLAKQAGIKDDRIVLDPVWDLERHMR